MLIGHLTGYVEDSCISDLWRLNFKKMKAENESEKQ